jgi:PhnB protein
MSFNPYLFFSGGQCRAAFTKYQEIFGGNLEVMAVGDMPPGEEGMPGADPTWCSTLRSPSATHR